MLSGLGVEMGGFAYAEFRAIYEVSGVEQTEEA